MRRMFLFNGAIWWILGVIAAAWVIIDILKNRQGMDDTHKIIWIVAAVLFSVLTAIVYYFVVYNK